LGVYLLYRAYVLRSGATNDGGVSVTPGTCLLTDPAERAAYLAVHYWDYFNFADTTLISRPEITEQAFVDFISILPYTAKVQVAVDTLSGVYGEEMLYHFISLADKYLYEPNSPMYNEELHILVLRSLLGNPGLDDWDKERPRYLLEMALKNRPGDVAADFTYRTRDGAMNRLSGIKADYVVLYFNDPDCTDCQRVKEALLSLPVMNEFMKAGRLCLLSVCVEGKTPAWEKAIFPARWIDGYDEGKRLTREQVYDLKAMPTLYLLDSGKRVILKDASAEKIEAWLSETIAEREQRGEYKLFFQKKIIFLLYFFSFSDLIYKNNKNLKKHEASWI